jgi:hypothetical protein
MQAGDRPGEPPAMASLRRAVRAVILAGDDRVLLCRFSFPHPALPTGATVAWAAPGGGIEPGGPAAGQHTSRSAAAAQGCPGGLCASTITAGKSNCARGYVCFWTGENYSGTGMETSVNIPNLASWGLANVDQSVYNNGSDYARSYDYVNYGDPHACADPGFSSYDAPHVVRHCRIESVS